MNPLWLLNHCVGSHLPELKVLGRGKVAISNDLSVENILLVESLGYNLMSVIQLARSGFASYFDEANVIVTWKKSLKVSFVGFVENSMYVVDLSKRDMCAAMCLWLKLMWVGFGIAS